MKLEVLNAKRANKFAGKNHEELDHMKNWKGCMTRELWKGSEIVGKELEFKN